MHNKAQAIKNEKQYQLFLKDMERREEAILERNRKDRERYHANVEHYRELNRQRSKKYIEAHKEERREYYCEKVKCECGSYIARKGMAKHRRTADHAYFIKYPHYNIKKNTTPP